MADLPILFSAPMVRAILREIEQPGTGKTQTRRVLKAQPDRIYKLRDGWFVDDGGMIERPLRIPFAVGDRLWVREAIGHMPRTAYALPKTVNPSDPDMAAYYRVDFDRSGKPAWKPSIHMPRWASRLTLTVTDVSVQRLQEISEADAVAEGLEHDIDGDVDGDGRHIVIESWRGADYLPWLRDPIEAYADLWDQLNDARSYGWEANPWVAAYTFVPVLGNIAQVRA